MMQIFMLCLLGDSMVDLILILCLLWLKVGCIWLCVVVLWLVDSSIILWVWWLIRQRLWLKLLFIVKWLLVELCICYRLLFEVVWLIRLIWCVCRLMMVRFVGFLCVLVLFQVVFWLGLVFLMFVFVGWVGLMMLGMVWWFIRVMVILLWLMMVLCVIYLQGVLGQSGCRLLLLLCMVQVCCGDLLFVFQLKISLLGFQRLDWMWLIWKGIEMMWWILFVCILILLMVCGLAFMLCGLKGGLIFVLVGSCVLVQVLFWMWKQNYWLLVFSVLLFIVFSLVGSVVKMCWQLVVGFIVLVWLLVNMWFRFILIVCIIFGVLFGFLCRKQSLLLFDCERLSMLLQLFLVICIILLLILLMVMVLFLM